MASLYQRFNGKISTTNSFPHPPEASRLLGGQVADEENAAKTPQQLADGRPHVQYRKKSAREDEDVRHFYLINPKYPVHPSFVALVLHHRNFWFHLHSCVQKSSYQSN